MPCPGSCVASWPLPDQATKPPTYGDMCIPASISLSPQPPGLGVVCPTPPTWFPVGAHCYSLPGPQASRLVLPLTSALRFWMSNRATLPVAAVGGVLGGWVRE